ncbi:Isoamyl acetate-hydrolyzing esterase 1 -like protein [Halotydeus destructor]|nr:Isoamyl acetate-hydrolyzing esterase 1 -like protein [Halotydeus destructor]
MKSALSTVALLRLAILASAIGYSMSLPEPVTNVSWSKVILFGDSLTEWSFTQDGQWGTLLGDRLRRVADVLNRGFGGFTSRQCLAMLPQLFPETTSFDDVAALIILLGTNDGAPEGNSVRVPLNEYMTNMAAIVQFFVDRGLQKDKIVFMTPPPLYAEKGIAYAVETYPEYNISEVYFNGWEASAPKYAAACIEVGQALQVDTVNLYDILTSDGRGEALSNDGIHFSVEASKLIFQSLWPLVEQRMLKLIGAETLTPNFSDFPGMPKFL